MSSLRIVFTSRCIARTSLTSKLASPATAATASSPELTTKIRQTGRPDFFARAKPGGSLAGSIHCACTAPTSTTLATGDDASPSRAPSPPDGRSASTSASTFTPGGSAGTSAKQHRCLYASHEPASAECVAAAISLADRAPGAKHPIAGNLPTSLTKDATASLACAASAPSSLARPGVASLAASSSATASLSPAGHFVDVAASAKNRDSCSNASRIFAALAACRRHATTRAVALASSGDAAGGPSPTPAASASAAGTSIDASSSRHARISRRSCAAPGEHAHASAFVSDASASVRLAYVPLSRPLILASACPRSIAIVACVLASVAAVCDPHSDDASSRSAAHSARRPGELTTAWARRRSSPTRIPTAGLCTLRASGYRRDCASPRASAWARVIAVAGSSRASAADASPSRSKSSAVVPATDARNSGVGGGDPSPPGVCGVVISRSVASYEASAVSTSPAVAAARAATYRKSLRWSVAPRCSAAAAHEAASSRHRSRCPSSSRHSAHSARRSSQSACEPRSCATALSASRAFDAAAPLGATPSGRPSPMASSSRAAAVASSKAALGRFLARRTSASDALARARMLICEGVAHSQGLMTRRVSPSSTSLATTSSSSTSRSRSGSGWSGGSPSVRPASSGSFSSRPVPSAALGSAFSASEPPPGAPAASGSSAGGGFLTAMG